MDSDSRQSDEEVIERARMMSARVKELGWPANVAWLFDELARRLSKAEHAPTPDEVKSLVAELRAEAVQEHAIALELAPYVVNERGEKCPYPTTPVEQRLPSRAAAMIEALSTRAQVPEGWVLVPKAPTETMVEAGRRAAFNGMYAAWTAMLSAAPTISQQGEDR